MRGDPHGPGPAGAPGLPSQPRHLDFGTAMRDAFLDEVRRQPEGTFAELERTVTLSDLIANHPLDAA